MGRSAKSSLLVYVAGPLLTIHPVAGKRLPDRWIEGTTIVIHIRLCGIIPLGKHTLTFERIEQASRELQTREHDAIVRKWDHLIRVKSNGANQATYSDDIEIDAGMFTIPVYLFAHFFYRHRQRRWRKLAGRL